MTAGTVCCDDAAAAACYLLSLLRVTYLLSPPRTARAQSAVVGTSCLLSDGVTIDDISVCVL